MQNEFEKQVQQKMEELKLVPSEPVWQKVEMQIRKKKDRRRLIFWIPLLAVLLGGGLWIGINQYSNNLSYSGNNNKNLNHQTPKENFGSQPDQSNTNKTFDEPKQKSVAVQPVKEAHSQTNAKTETISINSTSSRNTKKQPTQKAVARTKNLITEQNKPSIKSDEVVFTENQTGSPEIIADEIKGNKQQDQKSDLPGSTINNSSPDKRPDSIVATERKDEVDTLNRDSIKVDSTLIKKLPAKKYAASKWKLAFTVSSGVSGSGRLNVFKGFLGENKSMDYLAAPNTGTGAGNGIIYYPPSEVEKGFSFAAGAGVRKQLTKRIIFSTGLQYNYYSNSILVGARVARDTTFSSYSVREYFRNNNFGSTSALEPYRNQYHFLSIPFGLEWQLLKKRPLNFYTGISVQYMVQTNGLIFDYSRQAYFHSKDAFNSVQFFSDLGLTYSMRLKKTSIAVGPQLQYGITRLEKDNPDNHLYMYGLKAQLQLK